MRDLRFCQFQRGADQIVRTDGNLRNVLTQHIGGNGYNLVFFIDANLRRVAILVNSAHFGYSCGNVFVVANCYLYLMPAEHAGNDRRRNAHGTDDDACLITLADSTFNFFVNLAGRPFNGKIAPIQRRTESAGKNDGGKIFGVEFRQIQTMAVASPVKWSTVLACQVLGAKH